ncbi:MAG: hypothetical protein K2V38_26835 [Gemmataceae bacterium]|nr:hypothetical protein [Gemmataceae bacterium]
MASHLALRQAVVVGVGLALCGGCQDSKPTDAKVQTEQVLVAEAKPNP